jgi:putative ABC transport system substrate-binding protein
MQFNRLKRREFITLLGATAAWPLAAGAQQPAAPVVASLLGGSKAGSERVFGAFLQGMRSADTWKTRSGLSPAAAWVIV